MMDREGSGYLAFVATSLAAHPGLRLSNTHFVCLGGSCLELGFVCMVRALNHLCGMAHPLRDHLKVLFGKYKINNNLFF